MLKLHDFCNRAGRSAMRCAHGRWCRSTAPLLRQGFRCARRSRRPKACLDYMNAGDTLVVWKLDRLGRSLPHLLAIVTDLKERGIAFRSLTEQMDTTTPHGELLFSLFGAPAQYERALTRARIMAGLAAATRRGGKGGRTPTVAAEKMEVTVDGRSHSDATQTEIKEIK